MKTVERICAHDVEFNYFSRSKHAFPNDSEIEHVRELINENYSQGELCMLVFTNKKERELRGWWQII